MPSLKDLKVRIGSVKSTQKITKAMKMVSASKLRRAREHAEAATPYAETMEQMLATLATSVDPSSAPALLVGSGKEDVSLLVVMTSDRGLCGGFNSGLIKHVKQHIDSLEAQGKDYRIICVGKVGYEQLKGRYKDHIVERLEGIMKKKHIPFSDAKMLADKMIGWFDEGTFDTATLFYNRFISAINQKPKHQQIIPLPLPSHEANEDKIGGVSAVYDYEPDETTILESLLPRNIAMQIYHAILENSAGEHGARMSAMDGATRNASEMIKKLTLTYNRLRQAAITKELVEIISGSEAV